MTFADLKAGEPFTIVERGAVFRKLDNQSARVAEASDPTEKKWVGARFFFGRKKAVTRA